MLEASQADTPEFINPIQLKSLAAPSTDLIFTHF